eukprot:CAMPEP_0203670522 /NCGR_PEP_ID=MMETSP0090-20130426/6571_1 /ASSEMBLY_ACC=CAM_ASM_001088 /TAXON_ID=426623 /ORGANISM="Chaetoceros affinis, Strain CCMP159" /LENGTH=369 /DNA_ID=CAMNT_0050535399 /DNA_START=134 /DNA_END=1240 /DNA_ORIENTATION=+
MSAVVGRSARSKKRDYNRDHHHSNALHSKTLRPIQTSELNEEHNHLLSSDGNAMNSSSNNNNINNNSGTAGRAAATSATIDSKKSVKARQRSISPHARALLSRTFSRPRSRSRSRSNSRSRASQSQLLTDEDYDDDDADADAASINSSSSTGSSSQASHSTSNSHSNNNGGKQMLVAVLSCRSDAYIAQKAPGSTSMLPRKAPSALKNFHELAVGVKDAYEAMGATPVRLDEGGEEFQRMTPAEREARKILFEFMGNINFLLALVDEVATDSATRGALKDDAAFKNLRDQIKKGNKVLERMLVRRDNKYTLFFRLVQIHDTKDLIKMKSWNQKVEVAVMALSNDANDRMDEGGGDVGSVVSEASTESKS